jgi:hypothetical protein
MAPPAQEYRYSYAEYLSYERDSELKHEYGAGEILAMAGGSRRHNALTSRVSAALEAGRRAGCNAFQSDQRVRVLATGRATYPDASMVCGKIEGDPADRDDATITNPTLIVEVLSPSTEQVDRVVSGATTSSSRRCKSTCSSARQRHASSATAVYRMGLGNTRTSQPASWSSTLGRSWIWRASTKLFQIDRSLRPAKFHLGTCGGSLSF